MRSKSTITILLVLLMASSFFVVNTTPTTSTDSQILEAPESTHTIAEAPSISPPHILVYTEYTDDRPGKEYENTMTAINEKYGTDYQQTNLTDYTTLDSQLIGKDILLIPEQPLATPITMKMVGTTWASTLTEFVNNGGVVVLLDFGNETAPGLGLHIYNESSLMKFGPVLGQYPSAALSEMHRHTFGDALSRRVEYQWTPRNNTFAVQTTDGVAAFDDYDTDSPVCVHKSMGKGHVVFIGFDMSDPDNNTQQIVGNAVRLPNHVMFDSSQEQWREQDWEYPANQVLAAWVEELLDAGFAVSRMDTFSPALFNASEVLICTIPYWTQDYGASEITAIDAYVADGGSVFIFSDWGTYGDEIQALAQNFGYKWERDSLNDTDNHLNHDTRIYYTGSNIISHSITTGVERVELYASDGFRSLPPGAEVLVQSDFDGTTFWSNGSNADGVATYAVSTYGSGRVAVCLDSNIFDGTEDIDGGSDYNYFDSNNSLLLMNTIRWLASDDITNTPPEINSMYHAPITPLNEITVTIVANIVDADGIDNATCYYRVNMGTWTSMTMTPDIGDDFIATIGSFEEKDDVDYWVRVFDNSSDSLETVSTIGSFEVFNQKPDIPVLNDPGTLDDDGIFLLNWTESTDNDGYVDHYEVQMDDTGTFSVLLDHWSVPINETWVNVIDNGTYYFRVKALDDHGEYAGFSNVVSIEVGIPVDIHPPVIADLYTNPAIPIHGDSVTIKAEVLDFTGIENVTCHYRVNGGTWSSLTMLNVIGDRYESDIGTFFVDDFIEYYVLAFDNSTQYNNATSGIQSFLIENQIPLAPDLLDPGTTISVSYFIANWTVGFDHEGAIDHYQFQVSISSEFATIYGEWNTTELSFNVTGLSNGVYYVRVRTIDDHDAASPWSDVESIEVTLSTTSPTVPTSPTSPTTGSPFDPDILDLVFLITTVGSLVIILIIVVAIVRQRSRARRQYQF
jgi:hypothetical protein